MSQFSRGPSIIAFRGPPPFAPTVNSHGELNALTCPEVKQDRPGSARIPLKELKGEIALERLPKTGRGDALRDSILDCARSTYLRNAAVLAAQINRLQERAREHPGAAFVTVMRIVEPRAQERKPLQFVTPDIIQQFGSAPPLRSVLHAVRGVAEACEEAIRKCGVKCRVVVEREKIMVLKTTSNQTFPDPVWTWAVKLIPLKLPAGKTKE